MNKRLGRDEWVGAALRVLADQGVEAVRVERLAESLGVTKGSFYWHFADRQALLVCVIEAWKTRATGDIIAQVEAAGATPLVRLRRLMEIVFKADGRLDRQVRAWSANDLAVRAAQDKIDATRIGYVTNLFTGLGFARAEAEARSRFVYDAMVGRFALGAPRRKGARSDAALALVFEMLVRRD